MTTVNNIADILRILREQPEWAEALRSALLSEEVLDLPRRLAEFAANSERRFAALEGDMAELKSDVAKLKADVKEIKGDIANIYDTLNKHSGDIGNLRGAEYERKIGNNISSIATQHLALRKVRVLKGSKAFDEMPFFDILDDAESRGVIGWEQRIDVGYVDIVLQGQSHPEGSVLYAALEVSVTVGNTDIERASSRASTLQRATGSPTLPVVIGANIDQARQRFADEQGVTLIAIAD